MKMEDDYTMEAWLEAIAARHKRETERLAAASAHGYFLDDEDGEGVTFERALDDILAELRATMLKKHRDYGPLNIARAPGGAVNGLRVRMHDKLARINNLHESGAAPGNEPLEDSFLDVSNYGIIGLMVLRGHWPGSDGR